MIFTIRLSLNKNYLFFYKHILILIDGAIVLVKIYGKNGKSVTYV